MPRSELSVISLFSGAMGLDLGLEQAGFKVRVAVECNRFAIDTIKRNRPDLPIIQRKLEDVDTAEILKVAGLRPGEPTLVTGGPSCQAFSTAGQRASISDPRGGMFREFLRVVKEARPQFFVMENVRGVLSAAIRHRPLRRRGPGFPPLAPEEELGSALRLILRELEEMKYYTVFDLVNAADFGVPQTRERLLFIGTREGKPISVPEPTHASAPVNGQLPWVVLKDALDGLDDPEPAFTNLAPKKLRFIKLIPEGGNWRNLPEELHAEALGGAFVSWGGRGGFFRRLAWSRPAPALTTRPDSKATMLCHPIQNRPLSVKEYARLQQFPDDWQFAGGIPQQYRQVGNAVPLGLGKAVGDMLREARGLRGWKGMLGRVLCANEDLLARMSRRPKTILNPPRMRAKRNRSATATGRWLRVHKRGRGEFQRHSLARAFAT